jgi:hypothetical protein
MKPIAKAALIALVVLVSLGAASSCSLFSKSMSAQLTVKTLESE